MRNVPFSDILFESLQVCGLDRTTLDLKTFGMVRDFCNGRISQIWDREQWSESVRWLEERYAGHTITGATVVSGVITVTLDEVELDLEDYIPTVGGQVTINFPTDRITGISSNISGTYEIASVIWSGTGRQFTADLGDSSLNGTISGDIYIGGVIFENKPEYLIRIPDTGDAVIGVYSADPRNTTRCRPIPFATEELGIVQTLNYDTKQASFIRIKGTAGPVWVQYKELCPRIYGAPWSATYSYVPNEQAYSGSLVPTVITKSGFDFFVADEPPVGSAPAQGTTQWTRIVIPWRFKDYLVKGILADYLRSEGQFQQAVVADQAAEAALQLALDTFLRQSQQTTKVNMINVY